MTVLPLSAVWFVLVIWLICRAFRQRKALAVLQPARKAEGRFPKVCVVVPARDESANIADCVNALAIQRAVDLDIVVVDDDSSDDTAAIVARLAREVPFLALLHAPELPSGWMGKPHACSIGASAAPADCRWLCFIDADVTVVHPSALATAVGAAQRGGIDLLSLTPRQELKSFAERLMMPCGLYLLAFSQDLSEAQAAGSGQVVATGQFMLFRREAYAAAGGHAAVRGEVCEDVALAHRLKQKGGRVLLQDGSKLLSTRMYTGWATLWPGIAKNLSEMLGGGLRTATVALIALAMAWGAVVLPAVAFTGCVGGSTAACVALLPAGTGSAAAFALHIAGAIHFGIPFWYGFLFPLGYSAGAAIGFDSLRWRLIRRIRWKGRIYQ